MTASSGPPEGLVCGRCRGPLNWTPVPVQEAGFRQVRNFTFRPTCEDCGARGLPLVRPVSGSNIDRDQGGAG